VLYVDQTELFLKGPIDWSWLARAGQLSGRALHVAIALAMQCGLERGLSFRMRRRFCSDLGLERTAVYRGLKKLEQAGLVRVQRRRGARPIVSLVGFELRSRVG